MEVARAANNLRPMSWEQPITRISTQSGSKYIVTFGSYASCARKLTIKRDFKGDTNLYSVIWEELKINTCLAIAGYIDLDKLYVIYENGKWLSD